MPNSSADMKYEINGRIIKLASLEIILATV
jgi:hypothetical protein